MKLCIPITAQTVVEALQEIAQANVCADWIELRLDYQADLQAASISQLVKECRKPVIATYRKKHGAPWLKAALEAGADFVDVEKMTEGIPPKRCIYSIHLDQTPPYPKLLELYRAMKNQQQPAMIKIVPMAHSFLDNVEILRLLKNIPKGEAIAFCMGEKGALSRYYAPAYGSFCTFGSLKSGKESAAGQPIAAHLKAYMAKKGTAACGVIGDPIAHSLSPAIHQAAYAANRQNFLFLPFHVKSGELQEILALAKKFPLKGLAVTIPHKEAVIPFLDQIDREAEAIGAVNTIVNQGGTLKGYNTDLEGALAPLKKRMILKGKQAVILGGGGAAKAFIYGLQKEGAKVTVAARTPEKLPMLTCPVVPLDAIEEKLLSCDLLIQATSVGMDPKIKETLVRPEWLHAKLTVFDCVYHPKETQLLNDARKAGCTAISGMEMFLEQARLQYTLFTGQNPPEMSRS